MKTLLQMKLGLRMKDLRAEADISQEQFAYKIGMDRSYFASVEVGDRNVTLANLAKIAEGFDMTLSEFFDGIPRVDPEDLKPISAGKKRRKKDPRPSGASAEIPSKG